MKNGRQNGGGCWDLAAVLNEKRLSEWGGWGYGNRFAGDGVGECEATGVQAQTSAIGVFAI